MALASGANIFVCMGSNPISVKFFFCPADAQRLSLCATCAFFLLLVEVIGHRLHKEERYRCLPGRTALPIIVLKIFEVSRVWPVEG